MRRRKPLEAAPEPAVVPANLLDPLFAVEWPGGPAQVEAARSSWLADHPLHDQIRAVREWQVQPPILLAGRRPGGAA